jgi:hypothetical protein
MCLLSPLRSGDGFERAPRPPGGRGDEQPAGAGEQGDDDDRRLSGQGVGAEAGDERAEDEAEVAPEAVDADDAGAVARLRRVRDGGDQRRVDERRSGAEQQRRRRRRAGRARRPGRASRP